MGPGINGGEVVVLILIAVILFGPDKLPELARRIARVLRYLRAVSSTAQTRVREELGPEFADFEITDLHPKTFVKKHLLDYDDIADELRGVQESVREADVEGQVTTVRQAVSPTDEPAEPAPRRAPIDTDAT